MSDYKTTEEHLRELYGDEGYSRLKQAATAKLKSGYMLSLREDIILNPEKYTFHPSNKNVPEAIQLLYSEIIQFGIMMGRSGRPSLLTFDNIFVRGETGFLITEMAAPPGYCILQIIYDFSQQLHPIGNVYPDHFINFIELLARLTLIEQLKILYYHPALKTSSVKGIMVFRWYVHIGQTAGTDPDIWRRLEEQMGEIDIEHSIHGHEFYEYVFYTHRAEYSMNGRGLLCYYKDVLEYTNVGVEQKNEVLEGRYEIDKRNASDRASAAAREQGLDDEETEAAISAAVAAVPQPIRVARYSLERLVEDMEQFFPNFLIMLYVFMIEEDIVTLEGRPRVPRLPLHVSRGPPRPTCSLM